MPAGRPSDYNLEIAASICGLISCGESLSAVCRMEGMPSKPTVLRWIAKHEEFRNQYREAKSESQDAVVEQIFDILDEVPLPHPVTGAVDAGAVTWAKNRADARKWYLAKIAPKKYGDKISAEHTGVDGTALMPTTIRIVSE